MPGCPERTTVSVRSKPSPAEVVETISGVPSGSDGAGVSVGVGVGVGAGVGAGVAEGEAVGFALGLGEAEAAGYLIFSLW